MIKAEIVAYSVDPRGNKLLSVLATFPRIILAEINTHRMLSKNTSSSRAIPFSKMVEAIQNNPFIPIAWQKEHSGMQGTEYITESTHLQQINEDWLNARNNAIKSAILLDSGFEDELSENNVRIDKVTKQICNRLLEPFMWTTMLITGPLEGGWDNFFNLRCPSYSVEGRQDGVHSVPHKSWKDLKKSYPFMITGEEDTLTRLKLNTGQAEIHMMDLAEKIYDAVNESVSLKLKPGEWHIPFDNQIKPGAIFYAEQYATGLYKNSEDSIDMSKVKISTAMGARTSYTIVGEEKELNYKNLVGLHDRLIAQTPPHSSPMEHCAQCMTDLEHESFIRGQLEYTSDEWDITEPLYSEKGWCRNFKGFIPYRYIVENNNQLNK